MGGVKAGCGYSVPEEKSAFCEHLVLEETFIKVS